MGIKSGDQLYIKHYFCAEYQLVDQFAVVEGILERDRQDNLIVLTNGRTITSPKTEIGLLGNKITHSDEVYKVIESYYSEWPDMVYLFYDLGIEKYVMAIRRDGKLFFIGINSVKILYDMWIKIIAPDMLKDAFTEIIDNRKEAFDNLK